ncbi:hypothetical protein K458DRAFT_421548 [Lentithecium fluviatile CBS 122367]|uniref:Uncharacterized protein n=1 Tax=Lentithecium fluviatile CBS 122367 TaxID=1168545 RepID=A0A6G1IQE2_9PLEO|nr:hypothetical protein K458DRAFT_421548 [Lentithecium fluviatile CBS 122367]
MVRLRSLQQLQLSGWSPGPFHATLPASPARRRKLCRAALPSFAALTRSRKGCIPSHSQAELAARSLLAREINI